MCIRDMLFLVGDAETLLLVDDEKSQILELHVFRQQLVGADEDVYKRQSLLWAHLTGGRFSYIMGGIY